MPDSASTLDHVQQRAQDAADRWVSLRVVSRVLRLVDPLLVALVGLGCHAVYVAPRGGADFDLYLAAILLGALFSANAFHFARVYEDAQLGALRDQAVRIAIGWALTFLVVVLIAFLTKTSQLFSRAWAVAWLGGGLGVLWISRIWLRAQIRQWRQDGRLRRITLIVGGGTLGARLIRRLRQDPENSTAILGVFDDRQDGRVPAEVEGVPHLGPVEALVEYCRGHPVHQVLVALPETAERRCLEVIAALRVLPVDIRLCTGPLAFHFPERTVDHVAGVPLLSLHDRPISQWDAVVKWLEDKIIAGLAVLVLSPLLLLIAVAIRLESRGPALFRQKRYGFNNQLITVLKFRTMHHGRRDEGGVVSVTRDDPRVTRLGRWLRRSSLDELPQLFNVLGGSMSIVGPRPHAVSSRAAGRLFEDVVEEYAVRHKVKPGITGWAQVNGLRGETDSEEKIQKRVEADLYYIENWSLGFDLFIIGRTLLTGWAGQNAY